MPDLPDAMTAQAIYDWYEKQPRERRKYLGMSQLGKPCARELWLEFRWVGRATFPGRMLRLFETGEREEGRVIENLRAIGCTIEGQQYEVTDLGGHVRGHLDGVILGLPESPQTWHLLEIKTASKKRFNEVEKHGLEAKRPEYYVQMQLYMRFAKLTRGVFIMQCKDDDRLYIERIKPDKACVRDAQNKALAVVTAEAPPERIGKDAGHWQCRFCPMSFYCWTDTFPEVSCRTCAHSEPTKDGEWKCLRELEMAGDCEEHIYLPSMLHWLEPIDGSPTHVEYKDFVNVASTGFAGTDKPCYSSRELCAQALSKGGR